MTFWVNEVYMELEGVEGYSTWEALSYTGERSEVFYEEYGQLYSLLTRKSMRMFTTRLKFLTDAFLTPILSDYLPVSQCGNHQNDDLLKIKYREALREFSILMSSVEDAAESLSFFEEHQLLALPSFAHTFDYHMNIHDTKEMVT